MLPPSAKVAVADVPNAVFAFAEPRLRRESAVFVRDERREAVLRIDLGGVQASIALAQVRSTLELAHESPDVKLLGLVGVALHYARAIRAGDPLPSELVDGRPSWTPKNQFLARAREKLERALKMPLETAAAQTGRVALLESDASPLVQALARGRVRGEDLQELVGSMARVDWLSRAVMQIQRAVGEMATLASKRHFGRHGELARTAALGLREASMWGTARAMLADSLVSDLPRLIVDMPRFVGPLWGHIATLRAFVLDVEPILELWNAAQLRDGGPSEGDLDAVARLVRQRCVPFQGDRFEWRPQLEPASGGFDV